MSTMFQERTHATDTRPSRPANPVARAVEILGCLTLAAVAVIHLADVSSKFEEVPYLGWAYVGLIAGCGLAVILLLMRDRRGWILGGGLALATMIGFVLSRTTGLPRSTDDIGNWSEALGTYSLVAEGVMVVLAASALARHRDA